MSERRFFALTETLASVALLALGLVSTGWFGVVLAVVGVLGIATGLWAIVRSFRTPEDPTEL